MLLAFTSLFGGEIEEKVARLIVVPACPTMGEAHLADLKVLVKNNQIGGLIFMSGETADQLEWIQILQNESSRRLFILADAEWGPAMRLKDQTPFPKNLTLGAITDEELLIEAGRGIGRACLSAHIDLNLAPVCDVNLNPNNPIIGMRSFGDDPQEVAHKAQLLMQGMSETGLLTCAKHFPGHGDTAIDSHKALPSLEGIKELLPFQALVEGGVDAVLVGHLLAKEIDETLPASLSQKVIEGKLRKEMGFEGLVIPDSLCMKGLTEVFFKEEIPVAALEAGCDILLYSSARGDEVAAILESVPAMIERIVAALPEEMIDQKVSRLPALPESSRLKVDEEPLKRALFRAALTEVGEITGRRFVEVTALTPELEAEIERLEEAGEDFSLILFCSPYLLLDLPQVPALIAYEDNAWTREVVSDYLNGTLTPSGKLPIHVLERDGPKSRRRAGKI